MIIDKNLFSPKNQIKLALRNINLIFFFFKNTKELLTTRTIFGNFWILIRPLVPVAVFTIVFGFIFSQNSNEKPFLIFLLTAYSLWILFDDTTYWTTRTFDGNKKVLRKFNLPFLLLPLGASVMGVAMSSINLLFMICAIFFYSLFSDAIIFISLNSIAIFCVSYLICYMHALGLGFILCVFNAKYRDTKFSLKIFFGLFLYLMPKIILRKLPIFSRDVLHTSNLTPILTSDGLLLTLKINYYHFSFSMLTGVVVLIIGIIFYIKFEMIGSIMDNLDKLISKINVNNSTKKVLFATGFSGYNHGAIVDKLIASKLLLQNVQVEFFICDKFLPGCMLTKIKQIDPEDFTKVKEQPRCDNCFNKGEKFLRYLNVKKNLFSENISTFEINQIEDTLRSIKTEDIKNFCINKLNIGEEAYAGTIRYFGKEKIFEEKYFEEILRKFLSQR